MMNYIILLSKIIILIISTLVDSILGTDLTTLVIQEFSGVSPIRPQFPSIHHLDANVGVTVIAFPALKFISYSKFCAIAFFIPNLTQHIGASQAAQYLNFSFTCNVKYWTSGIYLELGIYKEMKLRYTVFLLNSHYPYPYPYFVSEYDSWTSNVLTELANTWGKNDSMFMVGNLIS